MSKILLTPSAANVLAVYESATGVQIAKGMDWYADAHRVADAFAVRYGVTVDIAAGVIAAVSPLNSWGANVNLAARILAAGGLTAGYMSSGLRKCDSILAGADIASTLKGLKTVAFWEGIRTGGATDAVCIDRHAWDVAVATRMSEDTRPPLAGKRYALAADAYRDAAKTLPGLTAAQLQAITWGTWRNRYWSDGAFDAHAHAHAAA